MACYKPLTYVEYYISVRKSASGLFFCFFLLKNSLPVLSVWKPKFKSAINRWWCCFLLTPRSNKEDWNTKKYYHWLYLFLSAWRYCVGVGCESVLYCSYSFTVLHTKAIFFSSLQWPVRFPRFSDIIKRFIFDFLLFFSWNISATVISAVGLARRYTRQTSTRLNTNQITFILPKEMRYVWWSNEIFWLLYQSTLYVAGIKINRKLNCAIMI